MIQKDRAIRGRFLLQVIAGTLFAWNGNLWAVLCGVAECRGGSPCNPAFEAGGGWLGGGGDPHA